MHKEERTSDPESVSYLNRISHIIFSFPNFKKVHDKRCLEMWSDVVE